MGIAIADNFDHKSKKPLDARTSYSTLALMKAVTDANIYEGCEAYCVETDKYYKFLSTNTVDTSTGKWRERAAGGDLRTLIRRELKAGQTEIAFEVPSTGDYSVDFYTSTGVNYSNVAINSNVITLTFPVQSNDIYVYCEISEATMCIETNLASKVTLGNAFYELVYAKFLPQDNAWHLELKLHRAENGKIIALSVDMSSVLSSSSTYSGYANQGQGNLTCTASLSNRVLNVSADGNYGTSDKPEYSIIDFYGSL